jgi:hypothetical protein
LKHEYVLVMVSVAEVLLTTNLFTVMSSIAAVLLAMDVLLVVGAD